MISRSLLRYAIFFILSFIDSTGYTQISHSVSNDTSTHFQIKRYLHRFILSAATGVPTFFSLGVKSPLDLNSAMLANEQIDFWSVEFEIGFGYRAAEAKFYIGPFAKVTGFTLEKKYRDNDSLEVTGQYSLSRRDIEFSYSWFYNDPKIYPLVFEITTLMGYTWFDRKFDAEVQKIKNNEMVFEFHDQVRSKGTMFGGKAIMAYFIKRQISHYEIGKFNYTVEKGPYIALSYKNFSDIRQINFEVGWITISFANKYKLGDATYFIGIDDYQGSIRGRAYKIGLRAGLNLKAFGEVFKR